MGGGGTPQQPPAPDPWAVATSQGQANVSSAIAESIINNTNQVTPYGNIGYKETGGKNVDVLGHPTWIPQYTATTTLSPGMQNLFNQNLANSQQASDTAGALGKNVAGVLSNNVDIGPSATAAYLDTLNRQTLDPQFAQAQTALNQQLADQGLTPGSEGWKYAQTQFGLNKANTYNNMYLQGQNTAVQDILAQYNEPLNALSALQSGGQVGQPSIGTLAPAAQESIQPPPIAQMIQSNYATQAQMYDAQVQANAQKQAGMMGLAGSAVGALGGLFSDRKDKKDVEKLGEDKKTGFGIYAFRYKKDKDNSPKVTGVMAQDVEKKHPGSTMKVGGHMVVKPGFGIGGNRAVQGYKQA